MQPFRNLFWILLLLCVPITQVIAQPSPSIAVLRVLPSKENAAIASVAFSPDGKTIAAGTYRMVLIIDAKTGQILSKLSGHAGIVTALAFSPDGSRLAAAGGVPGKSGEVTLWNRSVWQNKPSAAPPAKLTVHNDVIYAVAFAPSGTVLAACSYDHLVSMTPINNGIFGSSRMLKDHTDAVYGVAFSPTSPLLASAAGDRTVKIWDTKSGKRLYTLSESTAELYCISFSPNGKQIAAGGADKTLRTWQVSRTGGKLTKAGFAHQGAILRVAFSGDGRSIFTAGEDKAIKRWEALTLAEQKVYAAQPDWPQGLALSPDGKWLAVGRQDGSLAVYDAGTGRLVREPLKTQIAPKSTQTAAMPNKSTLPGLKPGTKEKKKPGKSGPTLFTASLGNISPTGTVRGNKVIFTLSGGLISDASAVFFDEPQITGSIVSPPDKNSGLLKIEVVVGMDARIGIHRVYVQTPHGTTGSVTFAVGGWTEVAQLEANDTLASAQAITFPSTLIGAMDKPGDTDCFRFEANAGDERVFEVVAQPIRSRLQPVLTLMDSQGTNLAEGHSRPGRPDAVFGYRFTQRGTYYLKLEDFQNASGGDTHYRLNVGAFPLVTRVFPPGVQIGSRQNVAISGFNLGGTSTVSVEVPPTAVPGQRISIPLPTEVAQRTGLTQPLGGYSLVVGAEPQVTQAEDNHSPDTAQPLQVPMTVNGILRSGGTAGTALASALRVERKEETNRYFRFHAKKGQSLIVEIMARRLGSSLDPDIEILDAEGKPIERAILRAVGQTEITLNDRDSASTGIRIIAWDDFHMDDYIMVGREVVQIAMLPKGPDDDIQFRSYRGQRIGYFGTTPEYHSVGQAVYKVEVHPPGSQFSANGFPLTRLTYRNDDGGPLYGKDSYLDFTPPADGEYLIRLSDARGQVSNDFLYQLSVRAPRPDFRVSMSPGHPNVPKAGGTTVAVECERYEGFNGPIEVRLDGLPAGFSAPPTTIEPGETSAVLLLSHDPNAQPRAANASLLQTAFRLIARATIAGKEVTRTVEPENGARLVTVLPEPDVDVKTDRNEITLTPGGEVEVEVQITRKGDFGARIPIDVRNLPYGVRVLDIGLNGVLVTEEEDRRRFTLHSEPWVKPQTRPIYVIANVEGGTANAAPPLMLRIAPKRGIRAAAK